MAILDRIATVIRSNLNALINQAEDPEKMLDQILIEAAQQIDTPSVQDIGQLRGHQRVGRLRLLDPLHGGLSRLTLGEEPHRRPSGEAPPLPREEGGLVGWLRRTLGKAACGLGLFALGLPIALLLHWLVRNGRPTPAPANASAPRGVPGNTAEPLPRRKSGPAYSAASTRKASALGWGIRFSFSTPTWPP